jgi:6-phosphogluconolactonase
MKFGKVGQVGLVSAIALLVATLFSACSTLTVGFLFVATTKQTPGQMEVYEVNSESGVLRTIPTSPFPSGGRNPLAEVADASSQNLYVANNDDNNIVQFGIGTDGKLYPQSTINTPGTYPLGLALTGSYAYVLDTLGPAAGCSLANPCPGIIAGYAVTSATTAATAGSNGAGSLGQVCVTNSTSSTQTCSLGNPVVNGNGLGYLSLQLSANDPTVLTPTAVNVTANGSFVYVSAYGTSSSADQGYLFAFSAGSDGSLTPIAIGPQYTLKGQSAQMVPLPFGSEPVAMISDSGSQNLYVVDEKQNLVDGFSLASTGIPSLVSTAATGDQPSALTIYNDKFLYVTNSLDSTITAYNVSSGSLTSFETYGTGTNPVAIAVDPRNIGFLYTVNFLGNSLSGYQINPSNGTLVNTQASPYASSAQPTAISGVPHGGTATASGTSK